MKIREVRVQNLRNFGPEMSAVSFVDAVTGAVRPLTVLVGSNGSGKTTVLELIEEAVLYGCQEAGATGRMHLTADLVTSQRDAHIGVEFQFEGPRAASDKVPLYAMTYDFRVGGGLQTWLPRIQLPGTGLLQDDWLLFRAAARTGALIYFPTRRYLAAPGPSSSISQPPESIDCVYRYQSSDQYNGSLEQLWVWQNYLDLEAHKDGRPSLLPFVETIQTILGKGQTVSIHKGKVWIDRPQLGDRVRINELPSGEQQVLLIFGEIVRRLRPQAIVMIDELEMSLHPALQRVVLFHLRRLAQEHDLQVIVTTHSLEVVAAADPSEIVNLDDMLFVEQGARVAAEAQ